MRTGTFVWFAFTASVLLPVHTAATIGPALDVKDLTGRADLIVVGEVHQIRKASQKEAYRLGNTTVPATRSVATVSVDHVLKGDTAVTSVECSYLLPDTEIFVGVGGLEEHSYRLLFLKRDGSAWTFVSSAYPSLPAVSVNKPPASDVSKAVGYTLAAVVDSAAVALDQKRLALEALATLDGIELRSLLSGALGLAAPDLRMLIAATLMRKGDAAGLALAEKALLASDPAVSNAVREQAAAAVAETGNDVSALPALGRLLKAPDTRTRQSAAMALRSARSQAAVPLLAVALNDQDVEVQYSAVMGLAELTNDWDHAPAFDVFRRSPPVFVNYWKRWAVTATK